MLGTSYTFGHTYGATTGLPMNDTYPAAGGLPAETVGHGYAGGLDLPTTIGAGLTGFAQGVTYDAYGRVNQETIGEGTNEAYLSDTFDLHTGDLTDQLLTRAVATPSSVDEQAYKYDPSGNITRQISTRLGAPATSETQCYSYDQLDRLTMAWTATDSCAATPSASNSSMVGDNLGTSSAYWTSWTFDALGNRTSQIQHATSGGTDTTTSYTYNGNGAGQPDTLTATSAAGGTSGTASYSYDAAGNMTTRSAGQGTQALAWNDAGQLTAITGGITGGTTGDSHFTYDAGGSLLLQKDPGATTLYLPGEQITLDTTTQAAAGVRYYALPGGGTAYRTGTGTSYGFEITNQNGTAVLALDHTAQNPTWRQLTPYGQPRGTAVTWIDNRGFLNKPADAATGLSVLGARQYDPATGRFTSPDPLLEPADPQQLNGYAYAAGNPITQSDPAGTNVLNPPGSKPESPCKIDPANCYQPGPDPGPYTGGYTGPAGTGTGITPGNGGGILGGGCNPYLQRCGGDSTANRLARQRENAAALAGQYAATAEGTTGTAGCPGGLGFLQGLCNLNTPPPSPGNIAPFHGGGFNLFAWLIDHRRFPDYITIDGSAALACLPLCASIGTGFTFTRSGHIYMTLAGGLSLPGFSGAVRGGWLDQSGPATAKQTDSFVHAGSISAGGFVPVWPDPLIAGVGPAAAETWGNPGYMGWRNFATEAGPELGAGGHDLYFTPSYSWRLPFDLPSGW